MPCGRPWGKPWKLPRKQKAPDRDDFLLEITEAQADAGDIEGATAVAASIQDAKKRDKARAEIKKALARKKQFTDAHAMMQQVAAAELR